MRPADLVLLLLLVGAIGWLFARFWTAPTPAQNVQISSPEGRQQLPLDQTQRLAFKGPLGHSEIEIADGAVRFASSPCRHQICIRSGWHRRSGAVAACVPNRISLVLSGGPSGLDAISH